MAQVAGFAGDPFGHQRLSDPAPLRARAVAEAHRAHTRRLGRRAGGADLSRRRRDRLRAGRHRRRRRAVRRPARCGREYLVGCDGGRSLVRKAAGIEFPGWDPTTSALLAEAEMAEEPELGIRRTPSGTHALGKVEYEIKDGEVVYKTGGTVGVMLTESASRHERAHPARSQRGPHRRLRDRLRDPQSHLDHQVHRYDPAGRGLPRGTGPAGRRCGARAFPGRWTGSQHRCAGCGEPGVEAGPGGQGDVAGKPPGDLPRRAPPGRCPRAAHHDGASRAHARRRSHRGAARHRVRAAEHGRAAYNDSPR